MTSLFFSTFFVFVRSIYSIGIAIEAVSDSSRYFVIRVEDDNGKFKINFTIVRYYVSMWFKRFDTILFPFVFPWKGRTAFLGLGFGDRSDSFDLNVALQDHFKWVKNQEKIDEEKSNPKPELDLGFKAGQTITINMKITVSIKNRIPTLFIKKMSFQRNYIYSTYLLGVFNFIYKHG